MTTGYSLRGTMTMREFNRNDLSRPKRRSFNDWIADLQKLSGKRDVSQDDLTDEQIQVAFAESYALAEMADGRAREQRKDEIEE